MTCQNARRGVVGRLFFYLCTVICVLILCPTLLVACDESGELSAIDNGESRLIFVLNNGEENVECVGDEPYPRPAKDGYTFSGWYLDEDLTEEVDDEGIKELIADDTLTDRVIHLYAKWEEVKKRFEGVLMRDAFLLYDGKAHVLEVEGLPEGASVEYEGKEYINAGEYEVSAVVIAEGYYDLQLKAKLTIGKATLNIAEIKFADATYVWDGTEKSIELTGELPDGVSVSYEGNGQVDVGEYKVTAKFDVGNNYKQVEDLTATLTITEKMCTVTFIEEDGSTFTREVGYGKDLEDIPQPVARRGYIGSWAGASLVNICEDISVHAIYDAEIYEIAFNMNGGKYDGETVNKYTVNDNVVLPIPSREYYAFCGWYESEKFDGEIVAEIEKNSVGNRSYYAKWRANEYTVLYELNGGLNSMGNTTDGVKYVYTAESANLTLKAPSKRGYSFKRWTDDSGKEHDKIIATAPKNYTLYAEWEAVEYSITYYLNGGVNGADAVGLFTVEDGKIILPTPTRRGYEFCGWHLTETLEDESITSIFATVAKDIVLYAKWSAIEYEIKYFLDGGVNGADAVDYYTIEDEEIELPVPTKRGYKFSGWYMTETLEGESITSIFATEAKNIAVYAKWETANYFITYILNGGVNNTANIGVYNIESGVLTLYCAIKRGFIFKGWYRDTEFNSQEVLSLDALIDGDVALYARWEAVVYCVTYHLDDGVNNDSNPLSYTIESGEIVLQIPSKQGYEFKGWYLSAECDGEPVLIIDSTRCEIISLYAKWEMIDESSGGDNEGDNSGGNTGDNTGNNTGDDDDKKDSAFTVESTGGLNIITAYDYAFGYDIVIQYMIGDTRIDGVAVEVLSDAESVEFAEGFTEISADMLAGCDKLKRLILPTTLSSMPHGLLADCVSLEELTVPYASDRMMSSIDGDYYPLGVLFGTENKQGCYEVTIVKTCVIGGEPSPQFGEPEPARYVPTSLKSITILDGDIMDYALSGFNYLKELTILGNGTNIANFAFKDCSSLEVLKLPRGLTELTRAAVLNCANIAHVYVGSEVDIEALRVVLDRVGATDAEVHVYDD